MPENFRNDVKELHEQLDTLDKENTKEVNDVQEKAKGLLKRIKSFTKEEAALLKKEIDELELRYKDSFDLQNQ